VSEREPNQQASRRQFVGQGFRVMAACLVLPLGNLLLGCEQKGEEATGWPLTLALELAPLDQRVRLENNGAPVEIIRTKDQVIARSLLCTHQGCRVRWYEDRQLYICPCHEGKFDAEGEVVYGMPTSPLRRLTAIIKNDQIVVSG
jgi:cytochrome b6-f complex iron-sulfur subunit